MTEHLVAAYNWTTINILGRGNDRDNTSLSSGEDVNVPNENTTGNSFESKRSIREAIEGATNLDPDAQCNEESIAFLSKFPFNYKDVGIKLLGYEVHEVLDDLSEEDKRKHILHLWVEKEKDKATNRALQVALLKSIMEDNTTDDAVLEDKDYCIIVLVGKTGQGKSYTGNKLLGYDDSKNPVIKEWTCKDDRGLLKKTEAGKELRFISAHSTESVTEKCQMLSNEVTCICVLDVPGFGDSRPQENLTTIQVNAKFVNAIIEVQNKMNISYNRILYFLPFRGPPTRADAYLQDELKMLFHYFGVSVFKCMVIIATQERKYQKCPFEPEDIESLTEVVKAALKKATGIESIECPPIVYIALDVSPEELLTQIQTAKVLNECVLTTQQHLPVYSVEDNWEQWIARFEAIANEQFKNDDAAMLQWFKGHLTDEMKSSCCREMDNYKTVRAKVEEELYSKVFCLRDIPEAYSGEGDETSWEHWIEHFEKRASQRQLDDVRKLQWLQSRLTNKAKDKFNALSGDEKKSYIKTKEALQKQVYLRCFDQRGKKSEEDLSDYADVLTKLATNAYPDMPIEEAVLGKLNCYLHRSIQSLEFKSIKEAVSINFAVNKIKEPFTSDRCEGLDAWLQVFDSKCDECKLDNRERLLWLEYRLSGKAKDCYRSIPALQRKDYETAKNNLQITLYKNSFEDKSNSTVSRASVNDLAGELSQLAEKAFPDMPKTDRDGKIIKGILMATNCCFNLQPETIREACFFVTAIDRIPDVFTGTKDWRRWISTAEGYLSDQTIKMDAHEKVRCVHTRMDGIAVKLLQPLDCKNTSNFEEAIQNFEEKLLDHWLRNRKRVKSEEWDTYIDDMSSLAEKKIAPDRDNLILQHILAQVDDHPKCKTLQEAKMALMARELVKPYRNTEGSHWKNWRKDFEPVMNKHCASNEEKMIFLFNSLAEDAQQVYNDLNLSKDPDYSTAIKDLEKELSMRKFKSRHKKPFETWEMLRQNLSALAIDCYDNQRNIDGAVFDQIKSIIMWQCGIHLCAEPVSAEDAVFIVSAQEAIPVTFSGKENWEKWKESVNNAIVQCKITNDAEKIRFLKLRLTDKALELFETILCESINYDQALELLEVNIYEVRFLSRSKLPRETWQEFVDELKALGSKAKKENLDGFIIEKIQIDRDVGDKVRAEHPRSVEDAMIIASAKETIEETFSGDIELWDKWIEKFETKTEINGLNEYEKLLWFHVSLTKDFKYIRSISGTYNSAKQTLEKRIFGQAFQKKKKETYESFKHLASTLQSYAKRAFPANDAEILTLNSLKELMQNKIKDYGQLPMSTLDEAVTTFTALEEMQYKQYKDSDNWEPWLCNFEKAAEQNQLDDHAKFKLLKVCVTGRALSILNKCPHDAAFTSVAEKISFELKENARLSLLSCTKCSEKGNHPTCHTEMVYAYEFESGIMWYYWGAIIQFFTESNKVCKHCKGEFGTPGCSQVGSTQHAKHDCT